ncbi:MAG TPA: hypothetical protein VGB53_16405 [Rubricoccaceae bacterium]|jgi:hypothetical protein
MSSRRPVLAAVLLVLSVVGSALAPAAHWAGHARHSGTGNLDAPGQPGMHDAVHSTTCQTCAALKHRAALAGSIARALVGPDLPVVLEDITPVTPPFRTALARYVGRPPPAA